MKNTLIGLFLLSVCFVGYLNQTGQIPPIEVLYSRVTALLDVTPTPTRSPVPSPTPTVTPVPIPYPKSQSSFNPVSLLLRTPTPLPTPPPVPIIVSDFETTDGQKFKHPKIIKIDPDAVTVANDYGISLVDMKLLPTELKQKCGYVESVAEQAGENRKMAEHQQDAEFMQSQGQLDSEQRQFATNQRSRAECQKEIETQTQKLLFLVQRHRIVWKQIYGGNEQNLGNDTNYVSGNNENPDLILLQQKIDAVKQNIIDLTTKMQTLPPQ